MNSKKRILATLERKNVDRLPVDIWYTPEVVEELKKYFGVDNELSLWKAMGVDKIGWVFMDYAADDGIDAGSQVGGGAGGARTMWGVPLKSVEAGDAHYDEFSEVPMKNITDTSMVSEYQWWPDPDRFKYDDALALAAKISTDYAVIGPWVSLFEVYCQLRGIEQSLMDMALNPELVDAVLDRIESIQSEMMTRFLQRAGDTVDLVFVSDDLGMQENLLMSPGMWKRFLEPRMKCWCDLIHSFGKKVFYHSDGACESLIQPLIDCGIDVLNPIQHVCPGMAPNELKEKYGDQVIFHGGVDNQNVLPFGSADDVVKEVNMLMDSLGAGKKGYICASCHNIQAGTPVENILAMVDTAKNM
jgi:uroporphyrinogen decarboxylase